MVSTAADAAPGWTCFPMESTFNLASPSKQLKIVEFKLKLFVDTQQAPDL
jgi:hypothetical protein